MPRSNIPRTTTCLDCLFSEDPVAADRPARTPGRKRRAVRFLSAVAASVLLATGAVAGAAPAGAGTTLTGPPRPDNLPLEVLNPRDGYRLAGADGGLFAFGHQSFEGTPAGSGLRSPITGSAATPTGNGYWLAASDGGVFAYGDAPFHGSAAGLGASSGIVSMAATRHGAGYWLVASDGGVFAFGDAVFSGSLAGVQLGARIVDIAPTRSGEGYWLLGADGGVFAFGDAVFHGGLTGTQLGAPAVGLAPTVTGDGYWIAAADGGVFAFGGATYHGGAGGQRLNAPVVDISSTARGNGYWLAGRDGGVFAFGDATWHGSLQKRVPGGVVAITGGMGWGPLASPPPPDPPAAPAPVAVATAPIVAKRATGGDGTGLIGNDISYPQCGGEYPAPGYAYGIVGVSGGRAFKRNPCLADQWRWAKASGKASVYVNVNFPQVEWELQAGSTGPQPECNGHISCIAFNFGYNGILDALAHARESGVDAHFWWLDVETMNYWTGDTELNSVVIRGAMEALRAAGKDIGVYSTDYQWRKIAGGFAPGLPVWVAGAPNMAQAPRWCQRTFGGGQVVMVQTIPVRFDENIVCEGAGPIGRYFSE